MLGWGGSGFVSDAGLLGVGSIVPIFVILDQDMSFRSDMRPCDGGLSARVAVFKLDRSSTRKEQVWRQRKVHRVTRGAGCQVG